MTRTPFPLPNSKHAFPPPIAIPFPSSPLTQTAVEQHIQGKCANKQGKSWDRGWPWRHGVYTNRDRPIWLKRGPSVRGMWRESSWLPLKYRSLSCFPFPFIFFSSLCAHSFLTPREWRKMVTGEWLAPFASLLFSFLWFCLSLVVTGIRLAISFYNKSNDISSPFTSMIILAKQTSWNLSYIHCILL